VAGRIIHRAKEEKRTSEKLKYSENCESMARGSTAESVAIAKERGAKGD